MLESEIQRKALELPEDERQAYIEKMRAINCSGYYN